MGANMSQNLRALSAAPQLRPASKSSLLGSCVFAVGVVALSAAPGFAGCNTGDTSDTNLLTSSACQSRAQGAFSLAVGVGAEADGDNSMAIGRQAGSADLVVGAMNIGQGSSSFLAGPWSMAIGNGINGGSTSAKATGSYAIAIGQGGGANFTPAGGSQIQLKGALAPGFLSMAIGTASNATGGGGIAIGPGSKASANDSTAFGEFSEANGEGSVAIGLFSATFNKFALAFGRGARATKTGSVAIGYNSLANQPNMVSVGSATIKRRIANVANAVDPGDAVNLAQLQAATFAVRQGSQAGAGEDLRQELASLRTMVQQQQREIAQLKAAARH
jgi:autotransporter adhesin